MNKYKISITRWILIGVIGFLCFIFVLLTWYTKKKLVREYTDMFNQWNTELSDLKVMPTSENVFAIKGDYEWIVDREKEVKQLLLKRGLPGAELTPLQFKEELLSTQTKLKQLADIQGVKLQEDLGFLEYTAGEIPHAGEVVLLKKQLTAIDELVNLLLRHKVGEIGSIQRVPGVYYSEDNLYQEMAFRIEIKCVLEDLLGVLVDIANAPYILVVRSLKIDRLDESEVSVEMLVGLVEFM